MTESLSSKQPGAGAQQRTRHPIFGALKGTTCVPPGVDLTEPADPEWGKVYDESLVVPDKRA